MGYLEASMTPFYSLGVPQINGVAPVMEQAANHVLVTIKHPRWTAVWSRCSSGNFTPNRKRAHLAQCPWQC